MNEKTALRHALFLAWFIVVWDVIEGIVAVTAGLRAGSIALVGFGIDSAIEVMAAGVVIWHLRGGARQQKALRFIAVTFFLLAAYVTFVALRTLFGAAHPEASPVGIGLNVVALLFMVPIALAQERYGRASNNKIVLAQAQETRISNYLSLSLLVGLGLNALFGWWWADPVVALAIAGVALYSGLDSWRDGSEKTKK